MIIRFSSVENLAAVWEFITLHQLLKNGKIFSAHHFNISTVRRIFKRHILKSILAYFGCLFSCWLTLLFYQKIEKGSN